MHSFNVITGSGHCGTTWLANVLDSQPGVTFYHHFREEMTEKPWEMLDLLPPDDPIFNQYWRFIRGDLAGGLTGDANSWPPHKLLEVNEVQPIGRVIYLTRNGVQQLNSLATTSPALMKDPLPEVAEEKLERLAEFGQHWIVTHWTHWEKLCLMIAANDFMPDCLRAGGLTVDVYSLEELTTDLDKLREVAPLLDDAQLKKWQQTDINRKTKGDREPSTIWNNWTPEQRQAYRAIVGDPEL